MLIKITLLYAGLLGLMYMALTFNVIKRRRRLKVGLGHSPSPEDPLFKAVRIHANFAEFVPLILLLMALDELTGRAPWALHLFGSGLTVARILHWQGITETHLKSFGRFTGTLTTGLILMALSVLLIWKGLR